MERRVRLVSQKLAFAELPTGASTDERLPQVDLAGHADSAELLNGRSILTTALCVSPAEADTAQWSTTPDAAVVLANANSESIILNANVTEIVQGAQHSEVTPDSSPSISLNDLQQMALSRNPTLNQAHALIQQAAYKQLEYD